MNLKTYFESQTENVLFVHCNDCIVINQHIKNPRFHMISAFTNLNINDTPIEKDEIKFFIEQERINKIVLVGHYACKLLSHLFNKEIKIKDTENQYFFYSSSKHQFENYFSVEKSDQLKLLLIQLSFQVKKMQHVLKKMFSEYEICVEGILIDENNGNEVIGLDSLPHEFHKNTKTKK